MDKPEMVSSAVKEIYSKICDELSYFKLCDMEVKPCRSCGSCSQKTPGECVFDDDIKVIFHELVRSDVVVMLTPIRFGGYSSQLKKVVDKFMLLGLPLYAVKNGHMVHPPRYGEKKLVVIGVKERDVEEQEKSFKTLAKNNALNLNYTHDTIILDKCDVEGAIREINSLYNKEAV
jgi:multimeric flavodoxin WrbA